MSSKEINTTIKTQFSQTGYYDWKQASIKMLWSALQQQGDSMMCIGYKPLSEGDIDNKMASINIHSSDWKDARQQVLNLIWQSEKKTNPSIKLEGLEVWKENKLPVIDVKITNIEP